MKKLKAVLALLLAALTVVCTAPLVSAEWTEDVVLDNCDTCNWAGAGVKRKGGTEGKGWVTWTVSKRQDSFVVPCSLPRPVNGEGANTLVFDFYVSSADAMYTAGTFDFEMTSSGTCDVEEDGWNMKECDLEDGWNHIELRIDVTSQTCDLTRINYLRIYALGLSLDETLTVGLDNIHLTYKDYGVEDKDLDPSSYTIGAADLSSASPVVKNLAKGEPYNPYGVTQSASESVSTPSEDVPADTDGASSDTETVGSKSGPGVLAIILIAVGVLDLAGGAYITFAKKKKTQGTVMLSSALMCVAVGVCLSVFTGKNSVPATDGDPDGEAVPGTVDTVDENKSASAVDTSFLYKDQTGHPEVSAPGADVAKLLTVDPSYDTTNDYKVFFMSSAKEIFDPSSYPNIDFTETPVENGLTFAPVTSSEIRKMTIKERECWLFEDFRNSDMNRIRVSLSDENAEKYAGKAVYLNFITYVSERAEFAIDYVSVSGENKTVTVKTKAGDTNQWTTVSAEIPDAAFTRSLEGYDFHITMKGPEIIRLNSLSATDFSVTPKSVTGLIVPRYESDSYIVADANVIDFGAAGNGITDDTDAFRNAVSYVESLGGGTVYVPVGYYCLTDTITLPKGVGLVGELKEGTAEGSVLCIYGGKGETDFNRSAIRMDFQSAVMNLAFWYPEQTFVNGAPIPYPPTLTQIGSEGITVKNVTFVNAYFGLNCATISSGQGSNSLEYLRDVYGTCLAVGYENNPSYDIGRLENLNLSADYWLTSGLPGTPDETLLRTYMIRNSVGVILERIDWTYLADYVIEGYNIGILYRSAAEGTANGHLYNMKLLDCYYPVYAEQPSWAIISDCEFRAAGGDGATAFYIDSKCSGDFVFSNCTFESAGANAFVNNGKSKVAMTGCTLTSATGSVYVDLTAAENSFVNTVFMGKNAEKYKVITDESIAKAEKSPDYNRRVETKPASTAFIDMKNSEEFGIRENEDITDKLQAAIDSLRETGGTVYLGTGNYRLSGHIDVWAGVEVRGAVAWSHNINRTALYTAFGKNDPDGESLFTLYDGAGLRGIAVIYNEQNTKSLDKYSFTVRGNGKNVYVAGVSLPTSYNAVDFATHRCDNHYVEYLWAAPLHTGVIVGAGSENGIVRDCQFTPNTWCLRDDDNYWGNIFFSEIMPSCRTFVIGESKNEIFYHNFTYGGYEGLTVENGAENAYLIGHGVDSGEFSAAFYGDCTVTLVNTQLVNLNGQEMKYIYVHDDFTGSIMFRNLACWGSTRNAILKEGAGKLSIDGGLMIAAGRPMCNLVGGDMSVNSLINMSRTKDYEIEESASSLHISGNIYASGMKIGNDSGVSVTGSDIEK